MLGVCKRPLYMYRTCLPPTLQHIKQPTARRYNPKQTDYLVQLLFNHSKMLSQQYHVKITKGVFSILWGLFIHATSISEDKNERKHPYH